MQTLGSRIREARERKGLLQSELATLVGVKSSGIISNWEKDVNKPDSDKLVRLCKALDVSASYILDYSGSDFVVTTSEQEIIEKYRTLDDHGRRVVNFLLNEEAAMVAALMEQGRKRLTDEEAIALVARRYGHLFNSDPDDEEKSV
mgnify:CR=1 FL=1